MTELRVSTYTEDTIEFHSHWLLIRRAGRHFAGSVSALDTLVPRSVRAALIVTGIQSYGT